MLFESTKLVVAFPKKSIKKIIASINTVLELEKKDNKNFMSESHFWKEFF